MPKAIHEQAAIRFDELAEDLPGLVQEAPPAARSPDSSVTNEVPVRAEFNDSNAHFDEIQSEADHFGRVTGVFFWKDGVRFGISDTRLAQVNACAERIYDQVKKVASKDYVHRAAYRWIREKVLIAGPTQPISAFIERLLAKDVREREIFIPLANIVIAKGFSTSACGVELRAFGKSDLASWSIDPAYEKAIAGEYLGYGVAIFRHKAERQRAVLEARERATLLCSLLGFFSPAMMSPTLQWFVAPKGYEPPNSSVELSTVDGRFQGKSKAIRVMNSLTVVELDDRHFQFFRDYGFEAIEKLVSKPGNEYQHKIASAIAICARGAYASNPIDKLIFALSALESVLLRDDHESIQQNLGERIAFSLEKDANKRRATVALVKRVYKVRSNYIHHGAEQIKSEELEDLGEFLQRAFQMLIHLASQRFKKPEDLHAAIDRIKYGG